MVVSDVRPGAAVVVWCVAWGTGQVCGCGAAERRGAKVAHQPVPAHVQVARAHAPTAERHPGESRSLHRRVAHSRHANAARAAWHLTPVWGWCAAQSITRNVKLHSQVARTAKEEVHLPPPALPAAPSPPLLRPSTHHPPAPSCALPRSSPRPSAKARSCEHSGQSCWTSCHASSRSYHKSCRRHRPVKCPPCCLAKRWTTLPLAGSCCWLSYPPPSMHAARTSRHDHACMCTSHHDRACSARCRRARSHHCGVNT